MFAEIGLLVLEGDAAGLAARVSELSALHVESRSGRAVRGAGALAKPGAGGHGAPAALIHSPDS